MNIDSVSKNNSREGKYALLFGGAGYEREVSVAGAHGFLKTAESIGLEILPIFIDSGGDFYVFCGKADDVLKINKRASRKILVPTSPVRINGESGFYLDGSIIPIKLVFPLLHGDMGEDGVIQGLLSALNIDFVGADNFTGALAADKIYSKIVARSVGVPTLPEIAVSPDTDIGEIVESIEKTFGFPVIVKPARLGSSVGVSLAKSKQEFSKSLKKAFLCSNRIMVEPALMEKRELECAYYSTGKRKIITPPAEVSFSGEFYDFDLKYKSQEKVELIPKADVSGAVVDKIKSYTETLARAMLARHIARFDYFLAPNGEVYFNEVNTMPGMTPSSLFSKMLLLEGIEYSDFILSFKDLDT